MPIATRRRAIQAPLVGEAVETPPSALPLLQHHLLLRSLGPLGDAPGQCRQTHSRSGVVVVARADVALPRVVHAEHEAL